MSLASSGLPTLEDLHSKARHSKIFPHQYLTLESNGQAPAQNGARVAYVGPEDVQSSTEMLRGCTVFRTKRFNSGLFRYRPIHQQKSSAKFSSLHKVFEVWRRHHKAYFITTIIISSLLCLVFLPSLTSKNHQSHQEEKSWFRNATFYEIFPASFRDTDSDGYGDFQGIIQKLDYIRDLGMTAIRLNSIYSALDYPLEYEHIIDLRSADPHLGHMDDFQTLVQECHNRGLKIILDLNPTITSDQYTWALHWQRGIPGYEHFYASANRSKDPPDIENSEGPPPSDWELTQRTFGAHYVLNWSNEFVQVEYRKALTYWIDKGVDGFYMKHLEKMHVLEQHSVPSIIQQWRQVLDTPRGLWIFGSSEKRVLIVSSKFAQDIERQIGHEITKNMLKNVDIMDYPVLVGSASEMEGQILSLKSVSRINNGFPVPMWHLGSSDTFRFASRIDVTYHMASFYLLMALSGANSVFYGDEIGLKDSYDVLSERVYRGAQLTPMQWKANNSSGGFTDNMTTPWLPINPEHFINNVETQSERLSDIKQLIQLRQKFVPGKVEVLQVLDPNVIVLGRTGYCDNNFGDCVFLIAVNLGNTTVHKNIPDSYKNIHPVLSTSGTVSHRRRFQLDPGAALVLKTQKTGPEK